MIGQVYIVGRMKDYLLKQLQNFDLGHDEASIYLFLLERPNSTALKISRDLKLARTKVYRNLEKLISKGFVKEEIKDYGTKFVAESYEKLNQLILQRENNLAEIKANAPIIFNQLAQLQLGQKSESKILHYRGVEGLKQVTWNSTKLKSDLRIYEIELMHSMLDYEFSEKARIEFTKSKSYRVYQLTNVTKFADFTNIKEHVAQWEVRHVPKSELNIEFEVLIYNNVYCMYEYRDEDIFIVEIYNAKLADMQKQIFDFIWRNAKPLKKLSDYGAAELVGDQPK